MKRLTALIIAAATAGLSAGSAGAADLCAGYGPQAPRDITSPAGSNARVFAIAPAPGEMNLCNIHFHTNAEHKGPGFSVSAGSGEHGGFRCNETAGLTKAELEVSAGGHGGCHDLKPGDTVEVHWVYSSCDVKPGKGLGSCLSEQCANPQLRVESQVFLVVNDAGAADFAAYAYGGNKVGGWHQPKALPTGTGDPASFPGSTTGPSYTEQKCSPMQVSWSVRPACAKLNIATINAWCESNVFEENHPHGVRQLVTASELLAPMK